MLFKRSGNAGFTLVELLVVIAIIGILVALHNYHDTFGSFPSGYVHANRNFNDGVGVVAGGIAKPVCPGLSNDIGVSGHRDVVQRAVNTGLFFGNSQISIADITDGTSNTVAVGERDTENCRSGTWLGVRNPNGRGTQVVLGHSRPKLNQDTPAEPCFCCAMAVCASWAIRSTIAGTEPRCRARSVSNRTYKTASISVCCPATTP